MDAEELRRRLRAGPPVEGDPATQETLAAVIAELSAELDATTAQNEQLRLALRRVAALVVDTERQWEDNPTAMTALWLLVHLPGRLHTLGLTDPHIAAATDGLDYAEAKRVMDDVGRQWQTFRYIGGHKWRMLQLDLASVPSNGHGTAYGPQTDELTVGERVAVSDDESAVLAATVTSVQRGRADLQVHWQEVLLPRPGRSALSDEAREQNRALEEAIDRRLADVDLPAEFAKHGLVAVYLDEDGRLVRRYPDGRVEVIEPEPGDP